MGYKKAVPRSRGREPGPWVVVTRRVMMDPVCWWLSLLSQVRQECRLF